MSVIVDAIKRIAVIAKQSNFTNVPGDFVSSHPPYPVYKSVIFIANPQSPN